MTAEQEIGRIIRWFKFVCVSIRDEYEGGASHRRLDVDSRTLWKILNQLVSKEE